MMQRYVYLFKEGSSAMRKSLGLKGSRLCEIYRMVLPVPPGLVISTDACYDYYARNKTYPPELERELPMKLGYLECGLQKKLGQERDPLLVSVRGGAERQMPGLLDSCCNVGLNDRSVLGLIRKSGSARFAWDTYSRFIEDFSSVSLNVHRERFETARFKLMKDKGIKEWSQMNAEDFKALTEEYLKITQRYSGRPFPQSPEEQLWMAIESIYRSWTSRGAIAYRRANGLLGLKGTGITIQSMVYGNFNDNSGSGRVFSRNPLTGEKGLYGEYLINAQGEQLIGGRTYAPNSMDTMKKAMPKVYQELENYADKLEVHFGDMQDIQFTIQDGKLYILYSKDGKRTPKAGLKVAADMVKEGKLRECEALNNFPPWTFKYLLYNVIKDDAKRSSPLSKGLPGSLSAATGVAVFNKEKVQEWAKTKGKNVILFSKECSTEDYLSLTMANGYVTQKGGTTSDFAILARDIGKACVISCKDLSISPDLTFAQIGSKRINEGDLVTIDGATGNVYEGELEMQEVNPPKEYQGVMKWANIVSNQKIGLKVRNLEDAELGRKMGVEDSWLFLTEGCFSKPDKLNLIRKAIFTDDTEKKKECLDELTKLHKEGIYQVLKEVGCTGQCVIRTIDSSLNQYIPSDLKSQEEIAKALDIPLEKIQKKHAKYSEYSQSLGLRGIRLAILHPYILQSQAKAIFLAALECIKEGKNLTLGIEFPMVSSPNEFLYAKSIVEEVAKETGAEGKVKYKLGIVVEIPRAALTIDEVAKDIDFIHFGMDDLTQTTCGFSREDSDRFLTKYVYRGLYVKDPFESIDEKGVGEFIKTCVQRVKKANPKITFAAIGNHTSDLSSVEFLQKVGVRELISTPHLFTMSKLAAAQVGLKDI